MGKGRAVKKAKQLSTRVLLDPGDVEYMNKIVQETLENEFQIFRRLGSTKESSLTFKYPDDITLRNILILGNEQGQQLELADFRQSILSPPDIDIKSANENDLTVQIETLHLGWVMTTPFQMLMTVYVRK
ncbi:hypothetical protein ASPSYDRAFT_35670 [Aspergillus sydowii CBS 593.65]|uniref:Uncharacterized protein n=1 Tax=Aspergillus sydowii CBS 593.65 TaxID=1036612 RepID=A0A1L9T3X4_9EURO|nr:uncharacterized protein ASPSYDRAFT_35670 [Aspergillus sydowii CBS 593.65]OJJ54154.1 hypothetical protein ASPSYDRAFT_35670 [Aspergillus sydowii CBS 593.65]